MAGTPENKIRLLGKEIDPGHIGIAGLFIIIPGICSKNEKIALTSIVFGMGLMAYSAHKMEQENQKAPPS